MLLLSPATTFRGRMLKRRSREAKKGRISAGENADSVDKLGSIPKKLSGHQTHSPGVACQHLLTPIGTPTRVRPNTGGMTRATVFLSGALSVEMATGSAFGALTLMFLA
jgi:hypothetical protein